MGVTIKRTAPYLCQPDVNVADPAIIETATATGGLLRDSGLWGALGLVASALGWAVKAWKDEANGRLADQKEAAGSLKSTSVAMSEHTRANEVRNEAFQKSIESHVLAVAAIQTMTTTLVDLKGEVADLANETRRTREALLAKGLIAP